MFFPSRYLLVVSMLGSLSLAQDTGVNILTECTKPGLFALTFDDGPGPATGELLGVLKKKKVKATFFSLGVQARDINLGKYLKQALDDGHQIASHTDRHLSLNTLTVEEIQEEMKMADKSIKQATGVIPTYMRPPYGDCNPACQEVMKTMGYHIVAWNVDSNDWQYVTTPERYDSLVKNIVEKVNHSNPKVDSFVSLQHDIHDFSIERTAKVIDAIKEKGYQFTTVAECLGNQWPMYRNATMAKSTVSMETTSVPTPTTSTNSASIIVAQTNALKSTPSNNLTSESNHLNSYSHFLWLVVMWYFFYQN
ncbi:hypothetical protein K7432_010310 [Basidiobolus ranarum]|uniref:NodB homology domain-containing protein n=1 Tax=Basidiobolus ranarum TaxID=34480 RepID=A0ABR2WP06_9FUNG